MEFKKSLNEMLSNVKLFINSVIDIEVYSSNSFTYNTKCSVKLENKNQGKKRFNYENN